MMTMLRWIAGGVAVLTLAACGPGGPSLGELSPDGLFERGMREYEEEDWDASIRAFERLVLQDPIHPRVPEARFHLADAYFQKGEYSTAAAEFNQLAIDFPSDELADDARFKVCRAYEELSPDVQRDQEYTRSAIEHCRALARDYPTSEFSPRAREIAEELDEKLARKIFVAGEFYYGRNAYDSAILYYEDLLEQYPDAEVAPQALLRLVQINSRLGYTDDAEQARERLFERFPDSPEAEEARKIAATGS